MSSMPHMEGTAGQHLSWSALALKTLVVLLCPLVIFRFIFVDVWGGLNDAAVPILGLYLLRDGDQNFFACYERLSKIWLFNECCGMQKDVTFVSALVVFILVSLVCAANDAYLLLCRDPSISGWHELVAGNGLLNVVASSLAVHMWRVLHGKASFQTKRQSAVTFEAGPQPVQPKRRTSRNLEQQKAEVERPAGKPGTSKLLHHLTVPFSEEEVRRSRESSAEPVADRGTSVTASAPVRLGRRSSSWKLGNLFKPAAEHHRSSSQPPVVHPWLGDV
mmetsp:Transcript_28479/g.66805  ORF Transcript_28479/g.66805 Transcript_28479/m.66805 type:complete len:276 (-) Transcript_28479:56-883(-)